MKWLGALLVMSGGLAWMVRNLFANRGFISFAPGLRLSEPLQRAVIAWNGEEEILILSTDIHASDTSQVLEVLPLPSEPDVRRGDMEIFSRLEMLEGMPSPMGGGRGGAMGPAGQVTFHETIGAHDISVVHLLDRGEFVEWVEKYLASVGVREPQIPEEMREVIAEYVQDGFQWFVFDVLAVDTEVKTNAPIRYRFRTRELYYPLRVTRMGEGKTKIKLWIITRRPLTKFKGVSGRRVRKIRLSPWDMALAMAGMSATARAMPPAIGAATPQMSQVMGGEKASPSPQRRPRPKSRPRPKYLPIEWDDIRSLDAEVAELVGEGEPVPVRLWRLSGEMRSFEKDLRVA